MITHIESQIPVGRVGDPDEVGKAAVFLASDDSSFVNGASSSSMDRNLKLNSTAHQVGVKRFGLFHGAGIQAMYEMRLTEIKARRGIGEKEDWLDRQGVEELAANEFRITQTAAKIRRENIRGEERAIRAHAQVGREVRQAIHRLGNAMPEELASEPPIREIEKRLGAALPKPEADK